MDANHYKTERVYPVKIVSEHVEKEKLVHNVRAVSGMNANNVACEISDADIMAITVWINILHKIVPNIIKGLNRGNSGDI